MEKRLCFLHEVEPQTDVSDIDTSHFVVEDYQEHQSDSKWCNITSQPDGGAPASPGVPGSEGCTTAWGSIQSLWRVCQVPEMFLLHVTNLAKVVEIVHIQWAVRKTVWPPSAAIDWGQRRRNDLSVWNGAGFHVASELQVQKWNQELC